MDGLLEKGIVSMMDSMAGAVVRARKCVGVRVAESVDWKGKRREVASSQMWGKICGV
jgi:hypothetical protein